MASDKAFTAYPHDQGFFRKTDPLETVRKEFERRGSPAVSAPSTKIASESQSSAGSSQPQKIEVPNTITPFVAGDIWLCKLPVDPATRPGDDDPVNDYLYYPWQYDPAHGYYGWFVYNVISHNFGLDNPNDYLINLTDLHDTHPDLVAFGRQTFMPHHYGIDGNRIVVCGVYKGSTELMPYMGQSWSNELELDDNGDAKTNLHFRYYVLRKIKKLYKEFV